MIYYFKEQFVGYKHCPQVLRTLNSINRFISNFPKIFYLTLLIVSLSPDLCQQFYQPCFVQHKLWMNKMKYWEIDSNVAPFSTKRWIAYLLSTFNGKNIFTSKKYKKRTFKRLGDTDKIQNYRHYGHFGVLGNIHVSRGIFANAWMLLFFKFFEGHQPFCEAIDTTVLDFWWVFPVLQSKSWIHHWILSNTRMHSSRMPTGCHSSQRHPQVGRNPSLPCKQKDRHE